MTITHHFPSLSILALCLALSFAIPTQAQISHTKNGDVDEMAQEVLQRALNKLQKGTVKFKVTMVNKDTSKKETARMDAMVLYNRGKYRVEQERRIMYCDGKTISVWDKNAGEVTLNKINESDDDLMNPARLLSTYKDNFRAKYIREDESGIAIIDLLPKKQKSYYKIRIQAKASNGVIKSMELCNYDGSRGEYQISNFANAQSNDKDFVFDRHANAAVEVIDMR